MIKPWMFFTVSICIYILFLWGDTVISRDLVCVIMSVLLLIIGLMLWFGLGNNKDEDSK
jgi:hypothetical protein